jgi:hypothetical protein
VNVQLVMIGAAAASALVDARRACLDESPIGFCGSLLTETDGSAQPAGVVRGRLEPDPGQEAINSGQRQLEA